MKKNLIALAVAGVIAAPGIALADTTLYGTAHLSIDSLDNGDKSGTYLSSNSSLLGVKGSEDLGNGLTALFQLEGYVAWDGVSNWGSSSTTYVGLAGGFGTFLAGRLPASEQWLYDANLFADQIGDTGNFLPAADKANNALHYVSPDMNGFTVALTYVPDGIGGVESLTGADDGTWGIRGAYSNGPLALGLTYFHVSDVAGIDDLTETALTGSYDFGGFKLVAAYVVHDDLSDRDAWTIGGSMNVGAGTLKLQYTAADETSNVNNSDASMWAIGYDHPLSKRTTVYAAYAAVNNKSAANYSVDGYGHGDSVGVAAAGEDPSAFSFGIIHNF